MEFKTSGESCKSSNLSPGSCLDPSTGRKRLQNLSIRPTELADVGSVDSLFERVFGFCRTPGMWQWLYRDTPAGEGISLLAEKNGAVIGHAGAVLRAFYVDGQEVLCAQSVNAMTDPAYQRQGINKQLFPVLMDQLRERNVSYLCGFSNENSTHGVLQHQGRIALDPFPVLIRPLKVLRRPWRAFTRGGSEIPPQSADIPIEVEALYKTAWGRTQVGSLRDYTYLNWRYRRPGGAYQSVAIWNQGQLSAFALLGLRRQRGFRVGFVMDCVANEPAAWKALRQSIKKTAVTLDCDVLCALGFEGSTDRRQFKRGGYIPVPRRVNPEELVFSIRPIHEPAVPAHMLDKSRWILTWSDTDLV